MKFLLDHLQAQESGFESPYALSALQRAFGCRCSRAVFFRNSQCLSCDTPLGYEPKSGRIFAIEAAGARDLWRVIGPNVPDSITGLYRRCSNLNTAAACNWLIPADDTNPLCVACRLNRTIPDLSVRENGVLWGRLEEAKRRVVSSLIALELPVKSRVSEDPERGLAFDFLQSLPQGPRVITGHDNGVITINLEEADPVKRETMRTSMREPYRTLVGHFRHEVGHYYWGLLVGKTSWQAGFRELFGDERKDYAGALQRHYATGAASDWQEHYISAYASMHPWEDWAETWAHYMHMVDTLSTALSFGMKPDQIALPFEPFGSEALYQRENADAERFLRS